MKRKIILRTLLIIAAGMFMTLNAGAINMAPEPQHDPDSIIDVQDIDIDIHKDLLITIKGLITEYFPPVGNQTAYYVLKGRYGAFIKVNTTGRQPVINRKYKVKGVIKADYDTGEPYMMEVKRTIIFPTWIFFAIGGVGVLILAIVLLLTLGNKSGKRQEKPDYGATSGPAPGAPKSEPAQEPSSNEEFNYDPDFKTVKVVTDSGMTMVLFEGKLKMLDGLESGKEIPLWGSPNGETGILSVGKTEKFGEERAYHFWIDEPTVSRKHADLIWYRTKKRLVLKNYSKVNYSQVNGEEVMVDETRELKFGDKIKFGNREFEYIA